MAVGRSREVPLLEVLNNGQVYGRHSVPCAMAVVESLAALWRPAVAVYRFLLVDRDYSGLRVTLTMFSGLR